MKKHPAGRMVRVGYRTDLGRKRTNNEDAYVALLPPDTPPGVDAVLAVADGMGGHQAGEVASALAVRSVSARLGTRGATLGGGEGSPGYPAALRETVEEANRLIMAEGHGDRQGMGTTLTVALVEGGRLHLAHVGDSRAYLFRSGGLRLLTQDHSWVADEVRAGRLSPQDASAHPRRNILSRALGVDAALDVDVETIMLREGDRLLLASDGLHGPLSSEGIAAVLGEGGDPQAVCDRLVQQANERGGPDNITVVLASLGGAGHQLDATTIATLAPGAWRRRRVPIVAVLGACAALVMAAAVLWWWLVWGN